MSAPKIRVPLDWVAVDAIGALLAAAGVYGLLTGPQAALPELGTPGVAWLCLIAGVALMGLAMAKIVGRLATQRADATRRR
ncbi:MAG: hypothetical protein M5U08_06065 [Burkholderiales bacterium]|nr:hypothetical protein [Burkholderiales bacterium]